jgi:hypothetical protein
MRYNSVRGQLSLHFTWQAMWLCGSVGEMDRDQCICL